MGERDRGDARVEEEASGESESHRVGGVGAEGEVIRMNRKKERRMTRTNVDNFTLGIIFYFFFFSHPSTSTILSCTFASGILAYSLFFIPFHLLSMGCGLA